MKTFSAKPGDITHDWHIVDAAGVPLGRLASAVAQLIRGKHKPSFTPHMDGGDFVIVVNASKVKPGGTQGDRGQGVLPAYRLHGPRAVDLGARHAGASHPDRVIEKAVFGMLPKNSLSRQKLRTKLKVYAGADHPHTAQQPRPMTVPHLSKAS